MFPDTKKSKVAFIIPSLNINGITRSILPILSELSPQEFDITLIVFEKGKLMKQIPKHIKVEQPNYPMRTEKLRVAVSCFLSKRNFSYLFMLSKRCYHQIGVKFISGIRKEYYDVAVAYADGLATWYTANSINARHKVAVVHTDILQSAYNVKQEYACYKSFEHILFGSEASKQNFLYLMPELLDKSRVFHNIINIKQVLELAKAEESPYTDGFNGLRILTVGRLSHEKGVIKIPELLARLVKDGIDVHWYVIGDGPERKKLLDKAHALKVNDNLIMLGELSNPYPQMKACDIYVQPSNYEGFCISLAEARILKKTTLACNFAGAQEQIKNGVDGFITGISVDEIYPKLYLLASEERLRIQYVNMIENPKEEIDDIMNQWKNLLRNN